jgi:hypothetical protein
MLTIQSTVAVDGITGRDISDFLLDCTDDAYRRWWPGAHLQFHTVARGGTDHVRDVVYMDEYIGARRVRMTGTVAAAVPGRTIVWQLRPRIPLPVSLTLELADRGGGVTVRHTIRAGFTGAGRILDPLLRLYLSQRFAAAMDQHVRTEFPLLRDHLASGTRRAGRSDHAGSPEPGLQGAATSRS